ncbi:hypothetical protein RFI_20264 [Reticulomyxa filosa]|uniref:proteasome endopeptidase complex n=1 Tax=Reticulomyxa filosa TaxID=46433 RepID=X6MSV9_RETFI|nr:hypothetical protein RFI_20264 [Reticulomyxa filosa]|eukprot:ETO17068.1 hypothetical protein RFI_20264 [Reticulomyxa filosa]
MYTQVVSEKMQQKHIQNVQFNIKEFYSEEEMDLSKIVTKTYTSNTVASVKEIGGSMQLSANGSSTSNVESFYLPTQDYIFPTSRMVLENGNPQKLFVCICWLVEKSTKEEKIETSASDDKFHPSKFQHQQNKNIKFAHGTTTLGFVFDGGIIVAVDSRASMGSYIGSGTVKKIIEINDYLLGTMAGGAADCAFWERNLARDCRIYELRNGERISVAAASKMLTNYLAGYKGYGLSVGSMVAGCDKRGPQLYYVDSDAMRLKAEFGFSVGSGSTFAYGVLDTEYRSDLSVEDAIALAKRAIYHATHRDAYSGGFVNVYWVTPNGWRNISHEDSFDLHQRYFPQRYLSSGGGYWPTVVCGPPGVGKNTLFKYLQQQYPNLFVSVPLQTSRQAQSDDEQRYHLVSREQFEQSISKQEFAAYGTVGDDLYGISKEALDGAVKQKQIALIITDVNSAKILKKSSQIKAFHLFIGVSGTFFFCCGNEMLTTRLSNKFKDHDVVQNKLQTAETDLKFLTDNRGFFNQILMNDALEKAQRDIVQLFRTCSFLNVVVFINDISSTFNSKLQYPKKKNNNKKSAFKNKNSISFLKSKIIKSKPVQRKSFYNRLRKMLSTCVPAKEETKVNIVDETTQERPKYEKPVAEMRVLIIGDGESGKGTLRKQWRIIDNDTFYQGEMEKYKNIIQKRCVRVLLDLIVQVAHHADEKESEAAASDLQKEVEMIVPLFWNVESGAELGYSKEQAEQLFKIWSHSSIQKMFKQRKNQWNNDEYLLENLQRFSQDKLCLEINTQDIVNLSGFDGGCSKWFARVQLSHAPPQLHKMLVDTTMTSPGAYFSHSSVIFIVDVMNILQFGSDGKSLICNSFINFANLYNKCVFACFFFFFFFITIVCWLVFDESEIFFFFLNKKKKKKKILLNKCDLLLKHCYIQKKRKRNVGCLEMAKILSQIKDTLNTLTLLESTDKLQSLFTDENAALTSDEIIEMLTMILELIHEKRTKDLNVSLKRQLLIYRTVLSDASNVASGQKKQTILRLINIWFNESIARAKNMSLEDIVLMVWMYYSWFEETPVDNIVKQMRDFVFVKSHI